MNRISLVGRLRTQKLLGRTVLILLAFSLLTVGGSYLFVRGEMVSRYREQGMEGTMSMLQRTSTSLDRTIQALELQIQTFWKDDDVSSLLVAPEKPDFSRTSGAAAQIQGLREGNELIERCWLYLYQSGQILTDRQLLLEAGDPERPGQLERWSAAAESGTPSLWCEDGKIYLLVAFPQPKKLGLLIVQLSARDLFEQFQEGWSGLSGDPVYVYDGAGEPVFPNRMTYPEREELMVTGESPREGVYALSGQRDTVVCVARSQTAGWYCLTYWNSGDWLPSPQEILTAFLPAAAVLLLLILILSLVILQVIYRPIQRIVESMLTGQETEAGQDEAGLISAALARGQRENQRLTGLLSDVRPALAQRFFQSLLEGGQTEPEEVSRMLAALESPFSPGGDLPGAGGGGGAGEERLGGGGGDLHPEPVEKPEAVLGGALPCPDPARPGRRAVGGAVRFPTGPRRIRHPPGGLPAGAGAGDPGLPILCRGGGQPGQRKPAGALRRLAGGQTGPELPEILLRGGRAARPRSGRCGRI